MFWIDMKRHLGAVLTEFHLLFLRQKKFRVFAYLLFRLEWLRTSQRLYLLASKTSCRLPPFPSWPSSSPPRRYKEERNRIWENLRDLVEGRRPALCVFCKAKLSIEIWQWGSLAIADVPGYVVIKSNLTPKGSYAHDDSSHDSSQVYTIFLDISTIAQTIVSDLGWKSRLSKQKDVTTRWPHVDEFVWPSCCLFTKDAYRNPERSSVQADKVRYAY